jgi:hypothetical protein
MNNTFKALRKVRSFDQHYQALPAKVFPLLCPVREYEWIEVWQCSMVWSASGAAENDCIFTTDFPDNGREIWVVCRYEPNRAIEFVRIARDEKVTRLNIHLTDNHDGTTTAHWTHTYTGLNAAGNSSIENLRDEDYNREMRLLEKLLNHYLATGQMLKGAAHDYRQGDHANVHHRPDGSTR